MTSPPMLGPTIRAALKHAELSETALLTSDRATTSATSDWRAGLSSTLARPTPVASTATCQYSTWPTHTRAPSSSAWPPSTAWGTMSSRLVGTPGAERAGPDREEQDAPERRRADQPEQQR